MSCVSFSSNVVFAGGGTVLLAISLSWPALQAQGFEPFPLAPGAAWIYQGHVKWTVPGTNTIRESTLSWTMNVTATRDVGKARLARLRGHPIDLLLYEEGKPAGDYVLLNFESRRFYLLQTQAADAAWNAEHEAALREAVAGWANALFLDLPLEKDKRFGHPEMLKRTDTFYAWLVQDVRASRVEGIRGVPDSAGREEYELILRTMPDHQVMTFVPGLGITRYQYAHHGTVSQVDLRLVEFRPPSAPNQHLPELIWKNLPEMNKLCLWIAKP
jgi:hypothetical protein